MVVSCSFHCEVESKPIDIRDLCNLNDQGGVHSIALSPRFALAALERKCLRTHCRMLNDFSAALEKLVHLPFCPCMHGLTAYRNTSAA